jgi:hypothetical protein
MNQPISLKNPGLVYFWFLNDDCSRPKIQRMIDAFSKARVGGVAIHPRDGLLVPYGGSDWFELCRWIVEQFARRKIPVWIYDENVCPSGNAEGRILAENPEFVGREICRYEAPSGLPTGRPFIFPSGRLLWAGLVPPVGSRAAPVDLSHAVGMIRRHWEVEDSWDSRWYYPATPLYNCPRAIVYLPEMSLLKPSVPAGWRLVAFVARPAGLASPWKGLVDVFNPAATKEFLSLTHEKYRAVVGRHFGRTVQAFFLDEPKWVAAFPWTPGLFEDFQRQYGYDLRRRLENLLRDSHDPVDMTTRLHYRDWCTRRFIDSWLKPIADWCRKHRLALIGHISPEDDPVQQAACLGNLHRLQEHLTIPGIDLIVPAIGDSRHPLLNVGAVSSVSCAQQSNQAGTLSETLGCSGLELDPRRMARILAWQTVMGINTIAIHGAFNSLLGLRRYEAPPDFGPQSPVWVAMNDVQRALLPFWEMTRNATHLAPVAILWPIRSHMAEQCNWLHENEGIRKDLLELLMACLENQAGVHFIDEETLARARLQSGTLRVGRASYRLFLVPSCLTLKRESVEFLNRIVRKGFAVEGFGQKPAWMETDRGVVPLSGLGWRTRSVREAAGRLKNHPAVEHPLPLPANRDLRVTGWKKGNRTHWLVMNLGAAACRIPLARNPIDLPGGQVVAVAQTERDFQEVRRFDPRRVSPAKEESPRLALDQWRMRWPGERWKALKKPLAVYQVRPLFKNPSELIPMVLTPITASGGDPVADWVEYQARVRVKKRFASVRIFLEPTAVRGRMTLLINGRRWSRTIQDADAKAIQLNLDGVLKPGTHRLMFRFERPVPLDGIKVAPRIVATR